MGRRKAEGVGRNGGGAIACAVAFALIQSPASARDVFAKVTTDRPDAKTPLRLSESFRATLALEGPAPLRVELPQHLLDPITDRDWKLEPLGPPVVAPAEGKREKWSQTFRLSPYVTGDALPVIFAPVRVNGQEVPPGGVEVRVVSTIAEAKPGSARPVTGTEEPPPPPERTAATPSPVWWAIGGLVAGLVLALAWRSRKKPAPPSPAEWAATAFDRLERDGIAGAALVERATAILREFIERRFGIPATRLTTPELLAATAERAVWPVEVTDALRVLLDGGDQVRFAGNVTDDGGCRGFAVAVRNWVHDVGAAGPRPG